MRVASVLAFLLLAGCVRAPDSYPPPIQRKPLSDLAESASGMLVNMGDANASAYFVRDISPGLEGGRWRWANQRPELKVFLESAKGLKLVWDFSVTEVTFRETGPVTVSFFVNGQPVGRLPCPKPGDYKFEQPVRQDLVRANEYNMIAAQADKLWVSPADGAKLSFTMTRAGFLR
ncbi:MAG: hypothetical protein Q8N47_04285 [Bryobacterales bacterium]|nr:hypothetical protein [Bryobacterales bacterium]